MRPAETVILKAKFDPGVKTVYVLSSTLIFVFSVIGIVFLPLWLPIAFVLIARWFKRLECILTDKTLRFKKAG